MNERRVVVLAEAALDVLVQCAGRELSWGQAEQRADGIALTLGSSGAITAAALAQLGVPVTLVSVIGVDPAGSLFTRELQRLGVDTRWLVATDAQPTGVTVALQHAGDRAMLTATGTMAELTVEGVHPQLLEEASHLHISSWFLQRGLHAGIGGLLETARSLGVTTSLDPGWDPEQRWDAGLARLLSLVDWFLPNEHEAIRIAARLARDAGTASTDLDAPRAACALAASGCSVAVKCGEEGALLVSRAARLALEPERLIPLDTTGAGDNFDAGLLAGVLAGETPAQVLAQAVACARHSLAGRGGTGQLATAEQARALAAELLPAVRPLAQRVLAGAGDEQLQGDGE